VPICHDLRLAIVWRGLAQFFFTPTIACVKHSWHRRQTSLDRRHFPARAANWSARWLSIAAFGALLFFFLNRTDLAALLEKKATRGRVRVASLWDRQKNKVVRAGLGPWRRRWWAWPSRSWRCSLLHLS